MVASVKLKKSPKAVTQDKKIKGFSGISEKFIKDIVSFIKLTDSNSFFNLSKQFRNILWINFNHFPIISFIPNKSFVGGSN